MSKIRKSSGTVGRAFIFACIAFLFGEHGWAAEPMTPRTSFLDLPAATGMTAGALPQVYRFEIAAYLRNNQKSEEDSNSFARILDQISGWNSKVDPTENTYLALRTKCTEQKLTCDVIGLVEKAVGNKLTLEIDIFTTPAPHLALHSGSRNLDGKTIECDQQIMGEKSCREVLMHAVADKLAGLDKLHRPQGGGN